MSSVFAVQVMTGMENKVKKLLDWSLQHTEDHEVKEVHTFCQETRRVLASGDLGVAQQRVFMPGYVFVEMMESNIDQVSAVLWHIIKKIPGVVKQFTSGISEDEFERMQGFDLDPQVEMVIEENTDVDNSVLQYEEEIADTLHRVNISDSEDHRVDAVTKLERICSLSYKERVLLWLQNKQSETALFLDFLLSECISESIVPKVVRLFSQDNKKGLIFPLAFFEYVKSIYFRWKMFSY